MESRAEKGQSILNCKKQYLKNNYIVGIFLFLDCSVFSYIPSTICINFCLVLSPFSIREEGVWTISLAKECLEGGKLTVTQHLPILQLLLSIPDTAQSLDFQPSLDSHLEGGKEVMEMSLEEE